MTGRTGEEAARCLDCGAEALGPYCHACGQRHESRLSPLRRLIADAASDVLALDGRLARTTKRLFLAPGRLTEAYLAGRRTRYTPPIRIYVVSSVVYFGVLALADTQRFLLFSVQGPQEVFADFVGILPRLMFVLLPVFALLVQALHPRSGRLYAEHVVFSLHYHAVVFLIFPLEAMVASLLPAGGTAADVLGAALFVYLLVYLAAALHRVYGGSRAGAALRSLGLWILYGLTLGLAGTLSVGPLREMLWSRLTGG